MPHDLRVVNVVKNGLISPEWRTPLYALLEKIGSSSHRMAANYLPENMDLEGHLSFDLLVSASGEVQSFAGVYNGGRYPQGVYRILNRTWVADSLRVKHGAFPFHTSRLILPGQLENLKSELKLIFVSREKPAGKYFLRRWRAQQSDPALWELSKSMVQVVPDVNKASCFQYICLRRLQPVIWNPAEISEEEWAKISEA